jgi:hypothetical protein
LVLTLTAIFHEIRAREKRGKSCSDGTAAASPASVQAWRFLTASVLLAAIVDEQVAKEGGRLRTIDDRRAALERLVLPILGARQIHNISRTEIVRPLDRIASERGCRWLTTY